MSAEGREMLRRQQENNRRDLLVLIHRHLLEEGLTGAASAMNEELPWMELDQYAVCDNVDLSLILMDFQNFFQMRFHRKPKITKRTDCDEDNDNNRRVGGRRRKSSSKVSIMSDDLINENRIEANPVEFNNDVATGISIPKSLLLNSDMKDLAFSMVREFANPSTMPETSFRDVIGHIDVKKSLEEIAVLPMRHPELYRESGLIDHNGINCLLLSGPPGTGKTLLAKSVASSLNMPFLDLRPSSLASKWRGDGEKLIRCAFELARHNAPSVVFLDEAEAVLGGGRDREGQGERGGIVGEHEATRRCKSEVLVQLDGVESDKWSSQGQQNQQILFLAATNSPSTIDPAIMRRFQRVFKVGLPNKEERVMMINQKLKGARISKELDLVEIGEVTKGMSGSDLARICQEAKRMLFRKMVEAKTSGKNKIADSLKIDQEDMKTAIARTCPVKE